MGLGNKIKRIREGVEIDKLIKNLYGTNPYLEGYVFVDNEKSFGLCYAGKKLFYRIWKTMYLDRRYIFKTRILWYGDWYKVF